MLPKKGIVLPYPAAIADALQRQLGTTHQAVKVIRRWTGAGERTVKNWLVGVSGPSGEHLVELIRNSDEVLETLLLLADRPQIAAAKKVIEARNKLAQAVRQIDELMGERSN
jgi:hypothetical protein